jgi:DNA-directed RNA polymerase specialized sigma24 family protein
VWPEVITPVSRRTLLKSIVGIPKKKKVVIIMRLAGYTYKEIASVAKKSIRTVKRWVKKITD